MTIQLTGNLVGGKIVDRGTDDPIEVRDPADLRVVVGQVPAMGAAELELVFAAAERGAVAWRATGHIARGEVLRQAALLLRADSERLARLIVHEMGKTLAEARGEVGKAAEFFEYYAAVARLPFGQLLPDSRPGTHVSVRREPLGVVLLITPWNDPLLTPARKLAPALVAGNAVVIKPATNSPLIVLELARILNEAGLPAGALGTITGRGSDIGDAMVQQRSLRAVSFTGSTAVGLGLQRLLAGTQIRVQTEMGGKNAAAVFADADLDLAAKNIVAGAFAQAGQRCTATSRLIVVKEVADELMDLILRDTAALTIGSGMQDGVVMGPVVSSEQRVEIFRHIQTAAEEHAEVVAGGAFAPPSTSEHGAFVSPTVIRVTRDKRIWREEVFGPVLAVLEVADEDEAVAAVNDSSYGLSSAVFTNNLGAAERFVDRVDTGQVSVNQPTSGWDVHQPFGGFLDSGSPFKEQGLDALQFYTRTKTAAIRGL